MQLIDGLTVGGKPLLLPGGWAGLVSRASVMHIVERTGSDEYAFVTCNTGSGLQYHQSTPCDSSETPPKLKYRASMRIERVPGVRMRDAGFWTMLFSQWLNEESEYHRVEVLYDALLPWLCAGPS